MEIFRMTLDEYVLLTEDQKISVLWHEAKYVAERIQNTKKLFLYQVYSFYLEVSYSGNFNTNKMKPFSNTDELEPYLQVIDIAEITECLQKKA